MQVESRLAQLGFVLPSAPTAAGKYAPRMYAHGLLFISGQMPLRDGRLEFPGRVGMELSEADGGAAARLAALNVIAQIHAALHGFDPLISLLRVDGYVSSSPGWTDQPRVLDSASQLFLEALGEKPAKLEFWASRVLRRTLQTDNVLKKLVGMQLTV